MDILDIFLDILLKPPQPLMGLFFNGTERIFSTVEQYELATVPKILSVPLKWYIAMVLKGFSVPLHAVRSAIKQYRKDFRYR